MVNPVSGFIRKLDKYETRIIIPKNDSENYQFISLEANFELNGEGFRELLNTKRDKSYVRFMKFDKKLKSIGFDFYRTETDPRANMPLDCESVKYFEYERTCYHVGSTIIGCTDWVEVGMYENQVCSGPGGGGAGGGGSNYEEYTTNNNVTDPCIKAAVDNAVDENFKDEITELVNDVFGESEDFNIDIIDVTYLPDSVDGETLAMPQGDGLLFDIELNRNKLSTSSKEYITATIFHELLHAYLGYLDIDAFQDDTQHDTMANEYLNRLSESLTQRYDISEQDAIHLSWGGLWETSAWSELSTSKKNQIVETNEKYRTADKGTSCN